MSLKLPLEVGLQLMVSRPPACDHIVELLNWFNEIDQIIVVMEHPAPCMDLIELMHTITHGAIREEFVRVIWKQAVLACRHCKHCGVLHRDVKGENLLLQLDTFTVKLVDFGCSDLLQEELYSEYFGELAAANMSLSLLVSQAPCCTAHWSVLSNGRAMVTRPLPGLWASFCTSWPTETFPFRTKSKYAVGTTCLS
ncbi:hypothetical protein DPEC_G00237500 [Dallia pectoralis]|uniref:Uncharacterized protein n=1 Tax=Dallia pectoralis TaxID=75939 RepID=A0ACC2FZ18_DALPE|nr:hypothetical protein DPEC_G00237500 [Dallia pectoralis]